VATGTRLIRLLKNATTRPAFASTARRPISGPLHRATRTDWPSMRRRVVKAPCKWLNGYSFFSKAG
jgi:hypothetical protein